MRFSKTVLNQAHEMCSNHKPELELDHLCGCFYCRKIFHPSEITEWLVEKKLR